MDRPTDRPTKVGIEAPSRSLKKDWLDIIHQNIDYMYIKDGVEFEAIALVAKVLASWQISSNQTKRY